VINTELNIKGFSCKKIQNEEDTGFLFYGFLVVNFHPFITCISLRQDNIHNSQTFPGNDLPLQIILKIVYVTQ
jgi:hypothetical protein